MKIFQTSRGKEDAGKCQLFEKRLHNCRKAIFWSDRYYSQFVLFVKQNSKRLWRIIIIFMSSFISGLIFILPDLCPMCAAYYGNRAAAYMMLSQYEKALEDARRSTQLDHTFVKVRVAFATCILLKSGIWEFNQINCQLCNSQHDILLYYSFWYLHGLVRT